MNLNKQILLKGLQTQITHNWAFWIQYCPSQYIVSWLACVYFSCTNSCSVNNTSHCRQRKQLVQLLQYLQNQCYVQYHARSPIRSAINCLEVLSAAAGQVWPGEEWVGGAVISGKPHLESVWLFSAFCTALHVAATPHWGVFLNYTAHAHVYLAVTLGWPLQQPRAEEAVEKRCLPVLKVILSESDTNKNYHH